MSNTSAMKPAPATGDVLKPSAATPLHSGTYPRWRISWILRLSLIPLVALVLAAAVYSLVETTVDRAIRQDAARGAEAWAEFFAGRFDGLDNVLETGSLTEMQKSFISETSELGKVFRFKLYDSGGRVVVTSDEMDKAPTDVSLREQDADAMRTIEKGAAEVFVKESKGRSDRPPLYAEAYVPFRNAAGEIMGVAEVYLDQTSTAAMFHDEFFWLGIKLTAVVILAFLLPALAYVLHSRRAFKLITHSAEAEMQARLAAERQARDLAAMNGTISALNAKMADNVSRLHNAQSELTRRGKMAQLGQLTATVAHELRNPLAAVRTSAFLLQRKVKDKGLGVEPQLERISNGITRCDNIISQLLDFARTKAIQPEVIVFDDWLLKTIEEQAEKLPVAVTVEIDPGLGSLAVAFDPLRMDRVLINLMSNASEAMVGKGEDPSKFSTATPRVTIASRQTRRGIEISVSDNGPGISKEHLDKIFEPLFTTKSFGTGLGLPAVQKSLEQHGGGLEVKSQPGQGATFTAWWPTAMQLKEAV